MSCLISQDMKGTFGMLYTPLRPQNSKVPLYF